MAAHDLTFLSAPNFHSILDGALSSLVPLVEQAETRANLTTCYWSDEHCDCREIGTIHDLQSGNDFCARHFRMLEVSRG